MRCPSTGTPSAGNVFPIDLPGPGADAEVREETENRMARAKQPRGPAGKALATRAVTGLVLVGLAVVFMVENRDLVDIRVLVPVVSMPLWTALGAMLLIGFVVGLLVRRAQR